MAIDTVSGFVQAVQSSRILSTRKVTELTDRLQGSYAEPRALARDLLKRDWLTAYQVNQLFLGRGAELVHGPYILLERLGEGGMGQVYKARHRKLRRVAALKIIRKDRIGTAEAAQRFYREVEACSRLSHPNIVLAYDADEVADTRYLAMELVEGIDLGKLTKLYGPLPVEAACDFIRQAALGLQHAFERGLVHRDIKPSNLLLATPPGVGRISHASLDFQQLAGGTVKVLDLGLARLNEPLNETHTLTQAHAVLGTPDFIAPEQARDARSADIRSDLYSLGCTLYYLLTGQVPFDVPAPMEKLLKHYLEEAPRIETVRQEIPQAVGNIVRRLMAKNPADRYQTPAELAVALTAVTQEPVASRAGRSWNPSWEWELPVPDDVPLALPAVETVADLSLPGDTSDQETVESDCPIPQVTQPKRRSRRNRRSNRTFVVVGIVLSLSLLLLTILVSIAIH
jgi:eukaryotic-like serine/threonine-protein kinase